MPYWLVPLYRARASVRHHCDAIMFVLVRQVAVSGCSSFLYAQDISNFSFDGWRLVVHNSAVTRWRKAQQHFVSCCVLVLTRGVSVRSQRPLIHFARMFEARSVTSQSASCRASYCPPYGHVYPDPGPWHSRLGSASHFLGHYQGWGSKTMRYGNGISAPNGAVRMRGRAAGRGGNANSK